MRKLSVVMAACLALCLGALPAYATMNDFTGTWVNTNSNTKAATRVIVKRVTNGVTLQVFGKCHPSDCDWGVVNAEVYGPSVSQNAVANARAVSATYDKSYAQTIVVLTRAGSHLRGTFLTRFTDNSGRASYVRTETFKRAAGIIGGIVQKPGIMLKAPKQDCVSFSNANLAVKKVGASWKIVDGSHYLLDFGSNAAEASQALNRLRHYGFTQHCFVGRPGPSFDYWLKNGAAVTGGGSGEDCLGFNNANLEVKEINGRWKIVDGSHWMFDFASNQAEAETAFKLIKYFGFSKTCYVGRPNPSLTYMLK
jgi:hypothetical protein